MNKVRLDRLVVESGLAATREKARRIVLAGEVLVNDAPAEKPGTLVNRNARLRLRTAASPYVSRGGGKLAGALDGLGLDVAGLRALDIGASTGGFTDCLLQRGASAVTALDVGKGQLDWRLRSDPRVTVIEGVNARYLDRKDFREGFDLVTIDVSFISVTKILPAAARLLRDEGKLLTLVKPQFELNREDVESGGVIRDPAKHFRAVSSVAEAAHHSGLALDNCLASPLPGLEGNREFFLLMHVGGDPGLDANGFDRRARMICGLE